MIRRRIRASNIKTLAAVIPLLCLIISGCSQSSGNEYISARVSSVIDGDTIIIQSSGETRRVRLIGIDCPEFGKNGDPDEFMAGAAKKYVEKMIKAKKVHLEFDFEKEDRYGRWLCYVFDEKGQMINELLLKNGFALVIEYFPFRRKETFIELQREAVREGKGLFQKASREAAQYNASSFEPVTVYNGPSKTFTIVYRSMAKSWLKEEDISGEIARIRRYRQQYGSAHVGAALETDGYIHHAPSRNDHARAGSMNITIGYRDARRYINQQVTLEGKIVRTKNTGKVTFLDFDPDWKNNLSIVIFAKDASKFPGPPEVLYQRKWVRVTGTIVMYKGKPEIIVGDPDSITIIQNP